MQYDSYFPTVIGYNQCPFFDEVKDNYISIINTIPRTTPEGDIYYHFHKDNRFNRLNTWITESVNDYALKHKYPDNYLPGESWAIDYTKNQGQSFHSHTGWVMSTIFYLKSSEDDAQTVFKSPYHNDMQNPLNVSPHTSQNTDLYNEYTYRTLRIKPKEGMLVVFRSYLEHAVESKKKDLDNRIIMSYNYQKEKYVI